MKIASRVALAALGATALTALAATPASAQRVDRVVSFGDSFGDTGILVPILLADPALPAGTKAQIQTVYPTGRFSGGQVYTEILADILNADFDGFAVGGATAAPFPMGINNTNCVGAPTTCALGLTYQVDQYLNAAPNDPNFPTTGTTFGQGDLVTITAGGNDSRLYPLLNPAATVNDAALAGSANAAYAATQLDRLVAAGAPTISFLGVNSATAPEVALDPAAQALRNAFATAFLTDIQGTLAGYAANGTIVHYLSGPDALATISANPAAFGFDNGLVCPIFPDPTCVIDSSGYLFYGDALHLTSDGFAVLAQYIALQLTGPLTLQAPGDVGMDVARQFGRTLTARMDLHSPRDGDMPEGLAFFIVGDGYQRGLDSSLYNDAFDVSSVGVTVGGEYGFGSGVIGIAGNYSRGRANFGNDAAKVTTDSYQIGAYAAAGFGNGFIQGYLGYGWDSHDVSRRGIVENMSASPDGDHFIAGGKAGYLFPTGAVRIGPVVALDYAKADVDGYVEGGDPVLTLIVSDQSFSSLRGSLGIEARGDFDNSGVQLRPYASLVAEKELDGDGRSITFAQTSAPGIVNSFNFESVSTDVYARGTVGLSARIFARGTIDAGITTTFGKEQGNETSGHVGLKIGL